MEGASSSPPSDAILAEITELKEAYAAKYRTLREGAGAEDFPLADHIEVLIELSRIADAGGAVPQGAKKIFHDFAALWKALKVRLDGALEEEDLARQRARHAAESRQRADIEALTARVKALQPLWQPCEATGALDLERHARGQQRLLEHLVLQVEAQGRQIEALMGLLGAPQPLRAKYPGAEGARALLAAGYTPLALRSASYSVAELRGAGCTAMTLRASGYTATELKWGSYTVADLRAANFSAAEFKAADYSAADLSAYFAAAELKEAGYSSAEIKAAY